MPKGEEMFVNHGYSGPCPGPSVAGKNPEPYAESQKDLETRENNFAYHKPTDDQQYRYMIIRNTLGDTAKMLNEICPPSRERALAMTKLEEACFWANAAIARNETETEPPA